MFTEYDISGWDGDTKRSRAERAGAGDKCAPAVVPGYGVDYVGYFWELRGFLSDCERPIKPSLIAELISYKGYLLSVEDCNIILSMDRAYRSEMPKTIKFHQDRRDKIKG